MASNKGRTARTTTSGIVANLIRDEIASGRLRPGQRLRQDEIAERYDVSITPVREAFAKLKAAGLVQVTPQRGATVYRPTRDDVRHTYEIRERLETLAIAKAVPNMTPAIIDELKRIVGRGEEATDQEFLALNKEFHTKLYEMSNRPLLCSMIATLRDTSSVYLNMFVKEHEGDLSQSQREHVAILNACEEGDVQGAEFTVAAHLRSTLNGGLVALNPPSTPAAGMDTEVEATG